MSAEVKTMEVKKPHQPISSTVPKEPSAATQGAKEFLGDVKTEFSKMSWTDPEELKLYTKMVVGATFIMGMGIYGIDLFIQAVLGGLSNIIQFVFG